MNAETATVWSLVGLGVAIQLASVLGVLVARGVFNRLHFAGPAAMLAPAPIAAALGIANHLGQVGVKALLVALTLFVLNPVLVHATARAVRIREFGEWRVLPAERSRAREP